MNRAVDFVVRPVMHAWAIGKHRSAKDGPRPPGMAHTRASGPWPLHVLFIGSGIAVGDGVLTHDLAIPGHLARMLGANTSRGVEIDIVVDPEMTPASATATLSRIRVSHYDAIVVMLGGPDVEQLTPVSAWQQDLRQLLAHIRDTAPVHNETFVVTLPAPTRAAVAAVRPPAIAERHARRLNSAMADVCASVPGAVLVPFSAESRAPHADRHSAEVYRDFSREISAPISAALNVAPGSTARRIDVVDEVARQRAVDELHTIDEGAAARLDRITALAQQAFGVTSAAVTIIDGDWQVYASRQNIAMSRTPRKDAFCAETISGRDALVIADASIDPRYSENPLVTGEPFIRFYAGYPIEAPNGERVGALCVLHDEPLEFTEENIIQLRTLALFAQDELWSEGYHYERDFGQRTGDTQANELLKSGFQLR